MRILVVHNQLWAHYKSKLFSEIYHALQENYPGSEFLVVHIALHEASRSVMQNDEKHPYEYPYKVLFDRSLDSVGFQERRKALFKAFDDYQPTILNITGYFDWAQVLLMFYARARGVKVVLSSESSSMDSSRSAIKETIKKFIVNRANAFFCFGKTSADYLLSLGVKPSEIAVKNAAVIDEELIRENYDQARSEISLQKSAESPTRKFVYVGRLAPEKNLEMLIRAFAVVYKTVKDQSWKLLIVGDGPMRGNLEKEVENSGQTDNIIFAGGFPWHQVPGWLAKSDVLILPSKSEPWGLVVNEAMVCGMPVIVSENCGCAEDLVKNDVNGFTFDPGRQQELESALRFFINNPEHIRTMGNESLKLIAPFSSKIVASEMAKCYKKLSDNLL
jgi:glycosyltransferase involved in cell wall biosynthesis